jgi:hypothetical protein
MLMANTMRRTSPTRKPRTFSVCQKGLGVSVDRSYLRDKPCLLAFTRSGR